MSVKINISYENESEIRHILELLKPIVGGWNVKCTNNGKYKHMYLIPRKE